MKFSNNSLKSAKNGFTLIELVVVISIIGILTLVMLPKFSGITDNARIKAAKAETKNIYTILEAYYGENGKYPDKIDCEEFKALNKTSIKHVHYNPDEAPSFIFMKDKIKIKCNKDGDITIIERKHD